VFVRQHLQLQFILTYQLQGLSEYGTIEVHIRASDFISKEKYSQHESSTSSTSTPLCPPTARPRPPTTATWRSITGSPGGLTTRHSLYPPGNS